MLTTSTILKHYKRKDVQEAMIEHSKDREVAPRYGEAFGARPDALRNEADILEHAKNGATSFHCSEERWANPLQLATEMKPNELAALRIGWDLVIDVDCKNWEYSKLITATIVQILKGFGIVSVSVKFSGNKGFHIGVPFEAFPEKVHGKDARFLFPEGPRRIALYLVHMLEDRFFEFIPNDKDSVARALGLTLDEIMVRVCVSCNKKHPVSEDSVEFICPSCENRAVAETSVQYRSCDKCGKLMVRNDTVAKKCIRCGKNVFQTKMNMEKVIEIDTLLISSRHLYRAPYSLHEKSGLVSLPIDPSRVLEFDKSEAKPDNVVVQHGFLKRAGSADEARHLFLQAFDFTVPEKEDAVKEGMPAEIPSTAIPEQFFPDCVKKIGKGLTDGRKRGVFILINFLRSVGWSHEQTEAYLREWNDRNTEPLRENYWIGQLRYARTRAPILPPNCANIAYYEALGVKCAENVCLKCKNPVNRAKMMARMGVKEPKKNEKEKAVNVNKI
jgi:predicted RNA-binding Zn-ribbon protein involved in translation (DUF1610 family)